MPSSSSFYSGPAPESEEVSHDLHQGIIFAIHLTPTMYDNLSIILQNILDLIHELAKTLPNTGVGCYLFNCAGREGQEEQENTHVKQEDGGRQFTERKGVYRVFRLNDINSYELKAVNNLLMQSQEVDFFDMDGSPFKGVFRMLSEDPVKNYGLQLSAMLNQCQDDFTYIPKFVRPYTSRRVFLFTDCDQPFGGSSSVRTTLQNNIHDLNAARIGIIPFLIAASKDSPFDTKEYKVLLEVADNGDLLLDEENATHKKSYTPSVEQITLDKIQEKVSRTKEVKRTAFRDCQLVINDRLTISVRGYAMFNEVKLRMPDSFYDDNGRYRMVHTKTYKMSKATGEVVPKENVVRAFHMGDQYFSMDKKYYQKLLEYNEPGKPILRVLGFRSIDRFDPCYTIGTPLFLTPDEQGQYTHSRRTFSALYQALTASRKMCVVWGMPRGVSHPATYYLIPTDASLGYKTSDVTQNYPQGLAMIQIPTSDNIRMLPEYLNADIEPATTFQPNPFEAVVRDLTGDRFQPLENPQLSWHFKVFEEYLLQKEVGPGSQDVGQQILNKQKEMDSVDEIKQKAAQLRRDVIANKATAADIKGLRAYINKLANKDGMHEKPDDLPPSKRTKPLTDDNVFVAWKLGKLKGFSVAQLRSYINGKPNLIDKGRTKAVMIENISDYLERTVK